MIGLDSLEQKMKSSKDLKIDPRDAAFYAENGYTHLRRLSTGEVAGVAQMAFTGGLFVGLTTMSYRTRYCYETLEQAIDALACWDGRNDPSGPWIKRKGDKEYLNPDLADEHPGVPVGPKF